MTKRLYLIAMAIIALGFSACSEGNEDPTMVNPTDPKALTGTWVGDLTGKTFSLWNYGKAWNVWTFNVDGTGVCDTYFMAGEEPVAVQHQPFTYTAEDGKLVTLMEDGPWEWTYQAIDGKLEIGYEGGKVMTFEKANAAQNKQFNEWSKRTLLPVPGLQARYTIFVYGNCGGKMDNIIEKDFWEAVRPYLKDSTKVRVAVLYKYGKNTSSQKTDDGDVVWFELDSETDLDNLHTQGLNFLDMHSEAIATKLYDPNTIHQFIEFSSLFCPAEEYIFTIWGHGNGFDPRNDIPGKYCESPDATRGVIGDEWNGGEQLDMYELSQAIKATGRAPFKAVFFNNCLMGNMESLTELRDVAEYIACSAHLLTSHQYDFDFITDDGLVEATEAVNGTLRNKSGQAYSSLIIPSSEMVSAAAWQRITDFAARGGKVVFIGDKPTAIYAKSMMQPRPITPINGALHLTDSLWHPEITAFLPQQELTVVSGHADSIAYCARKTDRGMIFFILNQQAAGQTLTFDLDCMGEAQP